jgi:hypothetical protein
MSVETLSNLLNVVDNELVGDLQIYPNPANELINITGGSANTKFEMLDILGNKIKTGKLDINGNHKINTSSVLNGVYFIVLMEKGQKVTRKIIVH